MTIESGKPLVLPFDVMSQFRYGWKHMTYDSIEEVTLSEWTLRTVLNNENEKSRQFKIYSELTESTHIAWYFLNVKPSEEFAHVIYNGEAQSSGQATGKSFPFFCYSSIIQHDLPIQLLGRPDWKNKVNNLVSIMDECMGPFSRNLSLITNRDKEFRVRYKFVALAVACMASLNKESGAKLRALDGFDDVIQWVELDIANCSEQQFTDSLDHAFFEIKSIPQSSIIKSTLIFNYMLTTHAIKMAYKGIDLEDYRDNICGKMINYIKSLDGYSQNINAYIDYLFDKSLCINQALNFKPIKNIEVVFGIESIGIGDNVHGKIESGFLQGAKKTSEIERMFGVSAYSLDNIFVQGITSEHACNHAPQARPIHWEKAAQRLLISNKKEDLEKISYLLNEKDAPDAARIVCKRMLTETNYGTSSLARPLLKRCIKSIDGLIDELYLAVNESSRNNNGYITTLTDLGPPSDRVIAQLKPELKRLKIGLDFGL